MNLDDRLRGIVNTLTAQLEGKYHKEVNELAIAQIKQAFADEGYVVIPQGQVGKLDGIEIMSINGKEVMTGQEWYERFEREITNDLPPLNLPDMSQLNEIEKAELVGRGIERAILEAAKRASGIEENPTKK